MVSAELKFSEITYVLFCTFSHHHLSSQYSILPPTDLFGDGMSDTGYYELSMDGKRLKRNSQFGYKETTIFTINNSGVPSVQASRPVWKSIVYEGE